MPQVQTMARQMLGAVNEFVAASARERLAHGRSKALQLVADDPRGARSCRGDPKLDAPVALLEQDPALERKMQTYVDMPKKDRPTYDQIARELRKMNKKWSMQKKGKSKGKPWATKQISFFFVRLRGKQNAKRMPQPKATTARKSTTKGKGKVKSRGVLPSSKAKGQSAQEVWNSLRQRQKAGVTLPCKG